MPKKSVQDLILDEIKSLHEKLDRVLETEIPNLKIEVSSAKRQAGVVSTSVTLVGGALAVFLSWFHK